MRNLQFILVLLVFTAFSACEKSEGLGGTSSIRGNVFNTDYRPNFTSEVSGYDMPDEDVYIVYGSDDTYSDKVSTNYDGTFCFDYLREGNYTVFVYSDDSTMSSTAKNIVVKLELTLDKNENKDVGVINIANELDYDDGGACISGKVYKINYNSNYTTVNEEYYSPDEDVFIVYGNDLTYFDKTKTAADGSFAFNNLIKGNYRIYAFSEDVTMESVSNTVEISIDTVVQSNNQQIVLPDLIIAD